MVSFLSVEGFNTKEDSFTQQLSGDHLPGIVLETIY